MIHGSEAITEPLQTLKSKVECEWMSVRVCVKAFCLLEYIHFVSRCVCAILSHVIRERTTFHNTRICVHHFVLVFVSKSISVAIVAKRSRCRTLHNIECELNYASPLYKNFT